MSFEDDLRDQLQSLARPRPRHGGALATINRRVRTRRRARVVIGVATVVTALAVASVAVASIRRPSAVPVDHDQRDPDVSVGVFGVSMHFTVAFTEPRTLDAGTVRNSGRNFESYFASVDDPDGPPIPANVPAGTTFVAGGPVRPDCRRHSMGPVTLTIRSHRSDGAPVTYRYTATHAEELDRAAEEWCAKGLQQVGSSGTGYPDGRLAWTTQLVNPGPEPVTVRSRDYTMGRSHWLATSLVVPPRQVVKLTLRGSNVDCYKNAPWVTGNLTANGKPLHFDLLDGCG